MLLASYAGKSELVQENVAHCVVREREMGGSVEERRSGRSVAVVVGGWGGGEAICEVVRQAKVGWLGWRRPRQNGRYSRETTTCVIVRYGDDAHQWLGFWCRFGMQWKLPVEKGFG